MYFYKNEEMRQIKSTRKEKEQARGVAGNELVLKHEEKQTSRGVDLITVVLVWCWWSPSIRHVSSLGTRYLQMYPLPCLDPHVQSRQRTS